MAEARNFDIEQLLRNALAPVEPSASLSERLDERLTELTSAAFDELADWELAAMRDPRNWGRTGAAIVIGGGPAPTPHPAPRSSWSGLSAVRRSRDSRCARWKRAPATSRARSASACGRKTAKKKRGRPETPLL